MSAWRWIPDKIHVLFTTFDDDLSIYFEYTIYTGWHLRLPKQFGTGFLISPSIYRIIKIVNIGAFDWHASLTLARLQEPMAADSANTMDILQREFGVVSSRKEAHVPLADWQIDNVTRTMWIFTFLASCVAKCRWVIGGNGAVCRAGDEREARHFRSSRSERWEFSFFQSCTFLNALVCWLCHVVDCNERSVSFSWCKVRNFSRASEAQSTISLCR